MTDRELRKLKRAELLEMLLDSRKENEELKRQLREANIKLNDRRIMLDKAGSIAEAALQLNDVFELAQKAADQYLENVKKIVEANPEGDDGDVTGES
jgi:transposase-like protein